MRFSTSEDAKELLRRMNDQVGAGVSQPLVGVDLSPGDADREDARRPASLDVVGRIAHEGRVDGLAAEQLERLQNRLRIRLVPLRHVRGHDRIEMLLERNHRKCQINGGSTLGGDDSELAALSRKQGDELHDAVERLELVVERTIVLTVYTDEVVDPRWIEHAHL